MTVRRAVLETVARYDEHAHRADYYHQRRVEAIAAGEANPSTGDRPAVVFHLVPAAAFAGEATMAFPEDVGEGEYLPVLAREDSEIAFTGDGVVVHCTAYGVTGAFVRVSRNGVVEASSHAFFSGYEDDDRTVLPARTFESAFAAGVREYLAFLEVGGVRPPVRLVVSLVNVADVDLVYAPEDGPYLRKSFGADRVEPFGLSLRGFEAGPDVLAPVFDAVWNAAGFDGSRIDRPRQKEPASPDA